MPEQDYIRHLYEHEDTPINEIARRTGVCWRTAAKYAKREDWNKIAPAQRKRPSVMDPVAEVVDTWLLEDQLLRRKQRRNAMTIYELLRRDHGFEGSARTVRNYVQHRRAELLGRKTMPYVELEHPAGHAQVDFGADDAVRDGKIVTIHGLRLSFPFSNAGFIVPLPAENQECFLEGLKRLFERIGGVPSHLLFDNLSAAVVHVGRGEDRVVTEMFSRFKLHHSFRADFCGPSKANEKGNVENKVGYTRRRWLCPLQPVDSFEKLDEQLWQRSLQDMEREHYEKGETIADLWEQERGQLLPLPHVPFEVSRLSQVTLNNYAHFRFEGTRYEVPRGTPQQKVLLTVFWDRVEVRDREGTLLAAPSRHYALKEKEIDWAAHFEIYAQRPRAAVHAALFRYLPATVQDFLKEVGPPVRSARVRLLRDMLKSYPMAQVADALAALPPGRLDDRASLEQKLYAADPKHAIPSPLAEQHTPPEVAGLEPDTTVYDQLSPTHGKGMPS